MARGPHRAAPGSGRPRHVRRRPQARALAVRGRPAPLLARGCSPPSATRAHQRAKAAPCRHPRRRRVALASARLAHAAGGGRAAAADGCGARAREQRPGQSCCACARMRSAEFAAAAWQLCCDAAAAVARRRKGSGSDLGFRHVSTLLYEAILVRGPQITMNGPDFTALGFCGMGRTRLRSSLTGRASWECFGPFTSFSPV